MLFDDDELGFDSHRLKKAKYIHEIDQEIYMRMSGHVTLGSYWKANNPMRDIHQISVPVLCINALDDPVCSRGTYV